MSALFLSYYFPPMQYPQSIQIDRLAAHLGKDIDIYCGIERKGPVDAEMPAARSGITVHRMPWSNGAWIRWRIRRTLLGYRWLRPDAYRGWASDAARQILLDSRSAGWNVMVTFGQPMSDHVAGRHIQQRLSIPWVVHLSDPWVDNPYLKASTIEKRMNRRLEEEVFTAADAIVVTSTETAELIKSAYPGLNTIVVVPHAFDPDAFLPKTEETARSGPIIIRHVGNFYGPRTPLPLINALELLARSDPQLVARIKVELIGGIPAKDVPQTGAHLPDGLITISPLVSYRRSLTLMEEADLLLNIDAPAASSVFLPSKLVDYLGTGRPILAITPPGTTRKLVERMGGWIADPSDEEAIARMLRTAVEWVSANRDDEWGDRSVRAEYDVNRVAQRFDRVLDKLNTGNGPA